MIYALEASLIQRVVLLHYAITCMDGTPGKHLGATAAVALACMHMHRQQIPHKMPPCTQLLHTCQVRAL
jgi:uncharacterized Rossmann fold enzyme